MCNIFSIHALSGFTLCANHMYIFRNVVPDANKLFHKFINKWIKINKYVDKQIFYVKRYFCAHSSGNDGTSSEVPWLERSVLKIP